MDKPVYMELDGKIASMVPKPDGGLRIIKSHNSPNIADFMQTGHIITKEKYDELHEKEMKEWEEEHPGE
jgi:hypothetical protein